MEKPTLTLILFCYNHELYIEEALKSALEQDFEPLEIIVSDDCSTDNTFKIAESICKNYHGVKKLTVRRNEINIGLANNIKEAVAISTGRYLIMSSGDDISFKKRAAVILQVFEKYPNVTAVFTDYKSSGIERECETVRLLNEKRVNSIIMSLNCGGIGKGATYAYRRDVFKSFDPLPQFIKSEDKILPLVASLIGSVFYIPEKTIYYRLPIGSLSRNLESKNKLANHDINHINKLFDVIKLARSKKNISKNSFILHYILLKMHLYTAAFPFDIAKPKSWTSFPIKLFFKVVRFFYFKIRGIN